MKPQQLTHEQRLAIGARSRLTYIEAAPGCGKTTIAAHRYGVVRHRAQLVHDRRAVTAASFTRSATRELRDRCDALWGQNVRAAPHAVITLDTLVWRFVHMLLRVDAIEWPGGHKELTVRDSWPAIAQCSYSDRSAKAVLMGSRVVAVPVRFPARAVRPTAASFGASMRQGTCTHSELRDVLEGSLLRADIEAWVVEYMRRTLFALVVDEVFDANELDLALVRCAVQAGTEVTLVGDPWQALYRFRGARPDLVRDLVTECGFASVPVMESFRWRSVEQRALAADLRAGRGVTLSPDGVCGDVVLACEWKSLWSLSPTVLPLAFGSAKGNIPEAAATVLLDHILRTTLGVPAVYIDEALLTLGIFDPEAVERLDRRWGEVVEGVRLADDRGDLEQVYGDLAAVIGTESDREFPRAHANYLRRLEAMRERLKLSSLTPGITVHQAKGREWGHVVVALTPDDAERLAEGLSSDRARDRQLYVACTRAKHMTVGVPVNS